MPLQEIDFQPGINKEATDYSAQGGWVDGNLIRFRKGRVEKIGGWAQLGTQYFLGLCRALHSWISLSGTKFLGLGTTWKYYVEEGNAYNDITPIRVTTSAGDVTFAASNGFSTITITDTAHGAVTNDFVTFSGAASLGGVIIPAVLNQEYQILLVTGVNTYQITAKDAAGNTIAANGSDTANGGSSVVGAYQINVGLDVYVGSSGWGVGTWGAGGWGSASTISSINQLRIWTHDNFGENLIINPRGAGIYEWIENSGVSVRAVSLAGRSGARQVPTVGLQVITSETDRHLVVLGADPVSSGARTGAIDPMLVVFSSAEDELDFEPTTTNSAGDVRLSSGSFIVGGLKSRQEILVWTDTSLYSMTFIGPPLTFAVNLVNEGAGLLSPNAAANSPSGVFFASKTGFNFYNGSVQRLPCTVQEYVFNDIDLNQAFKSFMSINSRYNEIWFFYPSIEDGTGEISRYVTYNYLEQTWAIGNMRRYGWLDAGIEDLPIASAQSSGQSLLYNHETGYDDGLEPMAGVYIESADIDISAGEYDVFMKKMIPDMAFVTDVGISNSPAMNIVVKRRNFPGQSLITDSTTKVTPTSTFTSLRTRARQVVFRFESDDDNATVDQKGYKWRLGSTRVDLQQSGRRG